MSTIHENLESLYFVKCLDCKGTGRNTSPDYELSCSSLLPNCNCACHKEEG